MHAMLKFSGVVSLGVALTVSAWGDPTNAPVTGAPVMEMIRLDDANARLFAGLGLVIDVAADGILVKKVMPDNPGAKAGILEGDLIIKVNGQPTQGLSRPEAVKCLRGPVGSEVELTLIRKGVADPIKTKVTRQVIRVTQQPSTMPPPSDGQSPLLHVPGNPSLVYPLLIREGRPAEVAIGTIRKDGGSNTASATNQEVILTMKYQIESQGQVEVSTYCVARERWASLPSFDSRKGEKAPLSLDAAVQKAWSVVGSGDVHLSLRNVQLTRAIQWLPSHDYLSLWYYLVEFRADDGRGNLPGVMILLDGSVVPPVKTREAPPPPQAPPPQK